MKHHKQEPCRSAGGWDHSEFIKDVAKLGGMRNRKGLLVESYGMRKRLAEEDKVFACRIETGNIISWDQPEV